MCRIMQIGKNCWICLLVDDTRSDEHGDTASVYGVASGPLSVVRLDQATIGVEPVVDAGHGEGISQTDGVSLE